MRDAIRATSSGPPPSARPPTGMSSYRDERKENGTGYQSVHGEGVERAESVLSQHRRLVREISEDTTQNVSEVGSSRFGNDTLCKRMADIRMSPWRGEEEESEYRAEQNHQKLDDIQVWIQSVSKRDGPACKGRGTILINQEQEDSGRGKP